MPPRRRGKNLDTIRIVEILNADGDAAEIAEETDNAVSTVRKVRRLEGGIGDTFRLDFVAARLIEAGLIENRGDLIKALPADDEIAAVLGLHRWRKCGAVVQKRRKMNAAVAMHKRMLEDVDHQVIGMGIIRGCVERATGRGGRSN